jgi:hypothetical protein
MLRFFKKNYLKFSICDVRRRRCQTSASTATTSRGIRQTAKPSDRSRTRKQDPVGLVSQKRRKKFRGRNSTKNSRPVQQAGLQVETKKKIMYIIEAEKIRKRLLTNLYYYYTIMA